MVLGGYVDFGRVFSWILVPPIAAWLTIPGFWDIIGQAETTVLGYTFLFGLLWGVGGLTYGLGVRYLGVSLGSSVILGLSMVFGSLMPAIYYFFNKTAGKDGIDYFFTEAAGICVMIGLLVCVVGIYLCGRAGMLKERNLSGLEAGAKRDYNFGLGMIVATISGVLSACFNFGIESGKPMAEVANAVWQSGNPGKGRIFVSEQCDLYRYPMGGLYDQFFVVFLPIAKE